MNFRARNRLNSLGLVLFIVLWMFVSASIFFFVIQYYVGTGVGLVVAPMYFLGVLTWMWFEARDTKTHD